MLIVLGRYVFYIHTKLIKNANNNNNDKCN